MRRVFLLILIVLVVFGSVTVHANSVTTSLEVQSLAKKHANEDVNKIMPFLGGVLFGPLAPLYNYAVDPEVPANRILEIKEMLPEGQGYLLDVYIQTYRAEVKRIKANMGWFGWASWIFLAFVLFPY
ncbi:MAG: hypothetical protein H0Z24_08390 [Thermosipho sp. (in: Bacteria)]|nr:hypothetical protein [Thermosipho sp. (in: thermotogales)]